MKRSLLITGLLATIFCAVFVFIQRQFPEQHKKEESKAPFETFAFMRAFPDQASDVKGLNSQAKPIN